MPKYTKNRRSGVKQKKRPFKRTKTKSRKRYTRKHNNFLMRGG